MVRTPERALYHWGIAGRRRLEFGQVLCQTRRGIGPVFFKVCGRGLDRLLDIASSRLHGLFHFFEFFQVHGPVDLGLHIGHIALRFAQQSTQRTGHFGQLFGTNDDQRHDANQRHFGKT